MSTTKKILSISVKVITWLLVAFTVFMMIFTIFTVTTVGKNDRSIFGRRFYIVKTDSMSLSENNKDLDVHFDAGDIVIVKNVKDATKLEAGQIISFISTNRDSYGETITHMIRGPKYSEDGKFEGYITYGTNTGTDDEAVVEPEYVLGVHSATIPKAGKFFAFMRTTPGYITCILIPFLLLILYNGVNVIRLFRKYRQEQMADMKAEREQIAEERAETQRMMAELLALKEQLAKNNSGGDSNAPPAAEPSSETAETESTDETTNT